MAKDTFLKASLNFLKAVGFNLNDKKLFKTFVPFLDVLVYFMVYLDFILIVLYNWKGVDTIIGTLMYIPFFHHGYKIFSLMLKNHHYISALKIISKFTKFENMDEVIKRDIYSTVKIGAMFTKYYALSVIAVIMGYSLAPFWVGFGRFTPFDSYFSKYFDDIVFYSFFYTLQVIELLMGATNLIRYDTLFVSIITNINIEIKVLKYRIRRIAAADTVLAKFIKLLPNIMKFWVIKQCDAMFSDVLLIQFLTSTLVLSIGLFAIADSGFPPSIYVVIKFGTFFTAAMAQLLLYCTVGQKLIYETQSISDAIYNIKWWIKPQPELRRACLLIIQRANRLDCLNAAGVFVVDYQSYTQLSITITKRLKIWTYKFRSHLQKKWWVKPRSKFRQLCILMIQRANKLDSLTAAGMFIVNYESYAKIHKFGLSLFSLTQAMKT